jgi:hypothetical protein
MVKQADLKRWLHNVSVVWFFVEMPLSIGLSSLYYFLAVPVPSLLYFLFSLTYLSGSWLAGQWSGEIIRRGPARSELPGVIIVLGASLAFLLMGIIFAVRAFQRI